jgi:hypothetical protein
MIGIFGLFGQRKTGSVGDGKSPPAFSGQKRDGTVHSNIHSFAEKAVLSLFSLLYQEFAIVSRKLRESLAEICHI